MGDIIKVEWNQLCPFISQDTWQVYNSEYTSATFDEGVCTQTYLKSGRAYSVSLRPIDATLFPCVIGEILYCSYEIYPESDSTWSAELGGGLGESIPVTAIANNWTRVAVRITASRTGNYRPLIADRRSSAGAVNAVIKIRNAMSINLTQMFGAGKEPNLEEFEAQCALNGIDLAQYQTQDSGTKRDWIIPHYNQQMMERKKQILINSPHIESINNSIVSFKTDMIAPLKKCKVYFEPIQEGNGEPSPDNVREIEGWNGIQVAQTKENLIQRIYSPSNRATISNLTSAPDYKFIMASNVESYVADNPGSYENGYIDIDIDQTNLSNQIHIRAKVKQLTNPLNVNYIRISPQGKDVNASNIPIINGIIDSTFKYVPGNNHFLELKNCGATLEISELMLTVPDTDNIISLDWSSFIGTIYSGYVDLIKGQLVQTHKLITLDGTQTITTQQSGRFYLLNLTDMKIGDFYNDLSSICDKIQKVNNMGDIDDNTLALKIGANTNTIYFYHFNTVFNFSTVSDFTTWLSENKPSIVYPLAEPIIYQLSPQTLKTLRGVNNIWSDAGSVEVQYWTH